jgi:hypothetical protein
MMKGPREGGRRKGGFVAQEPRDAGTGVKCRNVQSYCSRLSWGSRGKQCKRVFRLSSLRALQDNL